MVKCHCEENETNKTLYSACFPLISPFLSLLIITNYMKDWSIISYHSAIPKCITIYPLPHNSTEAASNKFTNSFLIIKSYGLCTVLITNLYSSWGNHTLSLIQISSSFGYHETTLYSFPYPSSYIKFSFFNSPLSSSSACPETEPQALSVRYSHSLTWLLSSPLHR